MEEQEIVSKHISRSLTSIKNLRTEKAVRISESDFPISECIGLLSGLKEKKFEFRVFLPKLFDYTYLNDLGKFGIYDGIHLDYLGREAFISAQSVSVKSFTLNEPQVISMSLSSLRYGSDQDFKSKYLRLIIPTPFNPDLRMVDCHNVKIGDEMYFGALLKVRVHNEEYHVYSYSNSEDTINHLVIDSVAQTDLRIFKSHCDAILKSYGLISGNYFSEEHYIISSDDQEMRIEQGVLFELRESSILSGMALIDNINFDEYMTFLGATEKYRALPKVMEAKVFSNLCEQVMDNSSLARCCELILEGNSCNKVLLQNAIYSVALETITGIITTELEDRIAPVPNKSDSQKLVSTLKEALNSLNLQTNIGGMESLVKRVENINQPTNSEKLSKPFSLLGLKLTKEDRDFLNHRNKFLHGESPFSDDESHNDDLKQIALRLHLMINILILKKVGYRGHIKNYSAYHLAGQGKKSTSHFFHVIS